MQLRHVCLGLALAALWLAIRPRSAQAYHCENIMGVVHNAGVYYFAASGGKDYMDEGVDEIAAVGTHLAKIEMDKYVWLNSWTDANDAKYPWNSSWPTFVNGTGGSGTQLVNIGTSAYFKNVFSNPNLTTFVITTYCPNIASSGNDGTQYWYNSNVSPVPSAWLSAETTQIQNLCANLLANYSGKTFVIENWEGDGALQDVSGGTDTSPAAVSANTITNYSAWMNARAKGVHNAMAAKGTSTSNCYCAVEANLVADGIKEQTSGGGMPTGYHSITDDVLPNTSVDYASYSAYDSMYITSGTYDFANCVNWIELHCPSTVIGYDATTKEGTIASVGVGEFGVSQNYHTTGETTGAINNVLTPAISGATMPYCMYWNVYDNDLKVGITTAPQNGNDNGVQGYWMIKPDGTPDVPWHLWRWQCITTDSVRSSTTNIKAGLTNTYTSSFPSSGSLGTNWTTGTYGGEMTVAASSGTCLMTVASITNAWPYGLATLDVATASSLGRGLEPGEYCEYSLVRNSNSGSIGDQLFATTAACVNTAGTANTWDVYSTVAGTYIPISWSWDTPITANPAYNFNSSQVLGARLDSADGIFATVSFYLGGSYVGSWLYPTTSTVLNSVSMLAQDDTVGHSFSFGNISVYQQ